MEQFCKFWDKEVLGLVELVFLGGDTLRDFSSPVWPTLFSMPVLCNPPLLSLF